MLELRLTMAESKIKVLPYNQDGAALLANIREKDMAELQVTMDLFKIDAEAHLSLTLLSCSHNWSIFYGDELLGCCGVAKEIDMSDSMNPIWLLTTNAVNAHKTAFVKGCRVALAEMLKIAPEGVSVLAIEDYEGAHKLINFFGFIPSCQFVINGKNFIKYVLKGENL